MMMQQGHCGGNQMFPSHHQMPQLQPVVCPTQYRCHDQFFPVQQPVIHPIVNVNRQHPVVVPRHYFTETTENVMGAPVYARPEPGFGRRGRGFFGGFGRRGY